MWEARGARSFSGFDTNYPSLPILPSRLPLFTVAFGAETRFPRDAKSLNGFRYRIFRTTRFATCKFGVFPMRARARAPRRVFRDFARRTELGSRAHGILPAVTRYGVRIAVIHIIRIDLSLAASPGVTY